MTGVSQSCRSDIRELSLCGVTSSLFIMCSQEVILNETGVQEMLGCHDMSLGETERLSLCQRKCLDTASKLTNKTISGPCPPQVQAMAKFGGSLKIMSMASLDKDKNLNRSMILPFPNQKGVTGVSVVDFGEPTKCVQVPHAQWCLLTGTFKPPGAPAPLILQLGTCIPKSCPQEEVDAVIIEMAGPEVAAQMGLKMQCNLIQAHGLAAENPPETSKLLGWGGVPVTYPRSEPLTLGFWLTLSAMILFACLVSAGTFVDWKRESKERISAEMLQPALDEPGYMGGRGQPLQPEAPQVLILPRRLPLETFLNHWSLLRNGRSFMRVRSGDQNPFACMDSLRTMAMTQVILGHIFVYSMSSSGISNLDQFNPPYGSMGNVWFMMIPGCFYAVDTFFLMSGFLCCYGLQKKVFSKLENRSFRGFFTMYPKFLLVRFLRLLPLEMLTICICMFVLPLLGTGILWNAARPGGTKCFDAAGTVGCESYWWKNVLFIQNFGKHSCFGHTWYLAVDMQLYLTAPFFCLAYSFRKMYGWALLSLGLLVGVVCPIIVTVSEKMIPDPMLGGINYMPDIYTKPWCRCTPFFVGIALAWLWQERLEKWNFRHLTKQGRMVSYSFSVLGLGICAASVFGRIVFFQCDLQTCLNFDTNPAGKFAMIAWAGFSLLGWSVGLGIIMLLCFMGRFLPVLQNMLNLTMWQPFQKLSYAAYLIHTTILILDSCQQTGPLEYTSITLFFKVVACVVITLFTALILHLLLEKPLANLQMKLLGGAGGD